MKRMSIFLAFVTLLVLMISSQQAKQDSAQSISQISQDDPSRSTDQDDPRTSFIQRADPNESAPGIATAYLQSRELIIVGQWDQAKALLENAIAEFPDSRHLHKQLAQLLWYFYCDRTKNQGTLKQAIKEGVRALEIGFLFLKVDHDMTDLLARSLAKAGDVKTLERIFTKAFAFDSGSQVYLDYADGLSLVNDPRTAGAFWEAVEREPEGTSSARIEFSEWLLDHGGETEVVNLLAKSPTPYLRFLRGVALERLNRVDEAQEEYAQFLEYSRAYPASSRFKIQNSVIQPKSGIKFQINEKTTINSTSPNTGLTAAVTSDQTIKGLSYLIWGEARGESVGGMRAVGWEVRSRALRGSVGSPACPYVVNSGSTLADQYKSVMCQSSQFNGMCLAWCSNPSTTACSSTTPTSNAASGVYNGNAPDPVSSHCPGGIAAWGGSYCADGTTCKGSTQTYRLAGALFNYSTNSTTSCPSRCAPNSLGKTCGNGSYDNCFYANPIYCTGSSCVTYSGSLSAVGTSFYGSPFSSTSGTHKGHLEGPESTANQDFDLYLEKGSSSAGPWQTVVSSLRSASVEDVAYVGTSSYYRWRVYSYSGTGTFKLYTKRP